MHSIWLPNAAISLILASIYSLCIGLSNHISISSILPPIIGFLLCFNKKGIIKKLLGINIFLIIIAFSYIIAGNKDNAILSFVRSNLIILFNLVLFSGISSIQIAIASTKLNLPKKITIILFLSIKFIQEFIKDLNKFKLKLLVRGFVPKTNLHTYQTYASFIAFIIFLGLCRAKATNMCMIARNFDLKGISSLRLDFKIIELIYVLITIICLIFHFLEKLWF